MAEEFAYVLPTRPPVIEIQMPPVELPNPAGSTTHLTPEQLQLREAIFTQHVQDQEAQHVAALFGMWTGTLLLHDLAIEHFSGSDDEEEETPDQPRLKDDEEK